MTSVTSNSSFPPNNPSFTDVDAPDEKGRIPLLRACLNGEKERVYQLLSAGANPKVENAKKRTALHYTMVKGDVQCVLWLVASGARLNAKDDQGCIPLHVAAWYGRDDLVPHLAQIMLSQNVFIDERDYLGDTPLLLACIRGHRAVVEQLLHAGANPNTRSSDGNTPLYATYTAEDYETFDCLLLYGAR